MLNHRFLGLTILAGCLSVLLIGPARGVEYEVTFDAVWSQATHPESFPPGPHFSGLIGGTHDEGVTFWEDGGIASRGIESMAETGSKSALTSEVNAGISAGHAGALISGEGISRSPGVVTKTFEVDSTYSLVTLVSMIAPSPDWFVGVSGLDVYNGAHWESEIIVPLLPYDAGTDSGVNYTSSNADTNPQEFIGVIDGFPFTNTDPLGTFTFRLRTGDFDGSGVLDAADINLLSAAVREGETDSAFDVNGDGVLDERDRHYWIEQLKGTSFADTNLDGVVDGSDFNVWNDNNGARNTLWESGDSNGDGNTDDADFFHWQANAFMGPTGQPSSVPEPLGATLLISGALICIVNTSRSCA
jgi:hypothetical protein